MKKQKVNCPYCKRPHFISIWVNTVECECGVSFHIIKRITQKVVRVINKKSDSADYSSLDKDQWEEVQKAIVN